MHDAGRRFSARKPQNLWPLFFELRVWGRFATFKVDWGTKQVWLKPSMLDPPPEKTKKKLGGKK
jgi:hypothetical protein